MIYDPGVLGSSNDNGLAETEYPLVLNVAIVAVDRYIGLTVMENNPCAVAPVINVSTYVRPEKALFEAVLDTEAACIVLVFTINIQYIRKILEMPV